MNSLIQRLNDKYLELYQLSEDFDKALANTTTVQTIEEDENGRWCGEQEVIDDYGINDLKKIYDRLEKILED